MKFFIALLFVAATAFAAENEVLLNCTRTNFTDLDKIQVTSSTSVEGEIIVTETDENGTKTVYTRDASAMKNLEIELSSWYGYSRRLYNDGNGWSIEHRDECSGGYSSVTCE